MATKFYLRDTNSDVNPGAELEKLASLTAGTNVAECVTNTVAGPTAGVQCTRTVGGTIVTWLTNPLDAVTISGNITFNFWMSESFMAANVGAQGKVERANNSGVVLSTIVDSEKGTELTGSLAVQNWTAAPTSTALSAGDRLKITVFGNDAGGNMGNGQTFSLDFDFDVASSADSWVQFTETITEQAGGTPAGYTPGVAGVDVRHIF